MKRRLAFQVALGFISLGYIIIALPYFDEFFSLHLWSVLTGPERYAAAFMLIAPGLGGLKLLSHAQDAEVDTDNQADTQ